MTAQFNQTRVPREFHSMVEALSRAHRDLARREAGVPLEDGADDPATVEEALNIVSKQRKWLYEYAEENVYAHKQIPYTLLRFT